MRLGGFRGLLAVALLQLCFSRIAHAEDFCLVPDAENGSTGNAQGIMFRLDLPEDSFAVEVTSFDINWVVATEHEMEVLTREGSYEGSELAPGDWTVHETLTAIDVTSVNQVTTLTLGTPLLLSPSGITSQSVYLNAYDSAIDGEEKNAFSLRWDNSARTYLGNEQLEVYGGRRFQKRFNSIASSDDVNNYFARLDQAVCATSDTAIEVECGGTALVADIDSRPAYYSTNPSRFLRFTADTDHVILDPCHAATDVGLGLKLTLHESVGTSVAAGVPTTAADCQSANYERIRANVDVGREYLVLVERTSGSGDATVQLQCVPPTEAPSPMPTASPTPLPTSSPTPMPTSSPTAVPTPLPTAMPTAAPTSEPTAVPTPTQTSEPTGVPTEIPTPISTAMPTAAPTSEPTAEPTGVPTPEPTSTPTSVPTPIPTGAPTSPPTPTPTVEPFEISAARFSPFGDTLHIDFSVSTNGVRQFPFSSAIASCSTLFAPRSLELLGDEPRCHFSSPMRLEVMLRSGATLMPTSLDLSVDQSLSVIEVMSVADLLRTDIESQGEELSFDGSTVSVSLPEDVEPPTAVLQAPARVGPCFSSNVVLTGALSSGFAGREAQYEWATDCAAVSLEETTTVASQTVDMSKVPAETSCTFELRVTNFLNVSSTPKSVAVFKTRLDEPTASIVPDSLGPWTRDTLHSLTLNLEFPECDSTSSSLNTDSVAISWRVATESNTAFVPSSGVESAFLSLRSYELESDESYTFTASVHDASASFDDFSVSFQVDVVPSEIVAIISNGDTQLSAGQAFEHFVGVELTFSAESSIDLDLSQAQRDEVDRVDWTFEWECHVIDLSDTSLEELLTTNVAESNWTPCNFQLETSGIAYTLPEDTLTDNFVYRIGAQVIVDWRSDSTSVLLVARADPVLEISISGPSTISKSAVLRLEGSLPDDDSTFSVQWEELSHNLLNLPETADFLRTPLTSPNLVIEEDYLMPGLTYTFALTVIDGDGFSGTATHAVTISQEPVISDFTARRLDSDEELSDEVSTLYALEVDAYQPGGQDSLTYRFSYQIGNSSDAERFILTLHQVSPTAEVWLPAGDIRVIAIASAGGSETEAFRDVFVPQSESCDVVFDDLARLDDAMDKQLSQESLQILQGVALKLLDREFVLRCVPVGFEDLRNDIFSHVETVWDFRSYHSREELLQVAQIIDTLARDSDYFTLSQVRTSLNFVDVIFEALDLILAEESQSRSTSSTAFGVHLARAISRICSSSLVAKGVAEPDNTSDLDLYCEVVEDIRYFTSRLLEEEARLLLVGEDATSFEADNIVAKAVRGEAGADSSSIESSDSTVSLDVAPSNENNGEYVVTVSSYDAAVHQCFQSTKGGQSLVSGVLDIDILECEEGRGQFDENGMCVFQLNNVTFSLSYVQPEAAAAVSECDANGERMSEELTCSWWNETTKAWSSEGCQMISRSGEEEGSVQCLCSHLTTFAVIKELRTAVDSSCSSSLLFDSTVALGWAVIFGIVAAVSGIQMLRIINYSEFMSSRRTMFTHAFLLMGCLAQVAVIVFLTFSRSTLLVEVFSALQLAMHYLIFALVCQQWAVVYHRVLAQPNKCRDMMLKYGFVSGAVIVSAVLCGVVVIAAVSDPSSDTFRTAILAGSIINASVSILTALLFLLYGSLLVNMILKSAKRAGGSSGSTKHQKSARKVFGYAVILSVSFIIEAGINMLSAVKPTLFSENFQTLQSVYFAFNVFSAVAVLWLMSQLVARAYSEYTSKKGRSSGGKSNTGNSSRESSVLTELTETSVGTKSSRGHGHQQKPSRSQTHGGFLSAGGGHARRSSYNPKRSNTYTPAPQHDSRKSSMASVQALSRPPTSPYRHYGAPKPLHQAPVPMRVHSLQSSVVHSDGRYTPPVLSDGQFSTASTPNPGEFARGAKEGDFDGQTLELSSMQGPQSTAYSHAYSQFSSNESDLHSHGEGYNSPYSSDAFQHQHQNQQQQNGAYTHLPVSRDTTAQHSSFLDTHLSSAPATRLQPPSSLDYPEMTDHEPSHSRFSDHSVHL